MTDLRHTLAIVGVGPRGHYALENFLRQLESSKSDQGLSVILFEESDQVGNGPVWDTSQPASNWSNINERSLALPERPEIQLGATMIGAFPSYHDWANYRPDDSDPNQPDIYPPRRTVGQYLSGRFRTLLQPLLQSGLATLIAERVDDVSVRDNGVAITTKAGATHTADQVLLTIGHQPTYRDPQVNDWIAALTSNSAARLFSDPYPIEPILEELHERDEVTLAVRGYGLATIDITRAAAEACGVFKIDDEQTRSHSFTPDPALALDIVPFSLDGLPMGPKPLNASLDMQFKPSQETLDDLSRQLSDPKAQKVAANETFLLNAIIPILAMTFSGLTNRRVFSSSEHENLERVILGWIDDPSYGHPSILSTENSPIDLLNELVGMATGTAPISLDYCVGQTWRHCHPTIYAALSHSALPDMALAKCIFLDEGLKRYSFGPPTESLQQLIALHDAGVLSLDYLSDPEVTISPDGWTLSNGSDQTQARVMVDAVLDSPKIKDVNSPLMQGLLKEGVLAPVHDDLGITTLKDGFIISHGDKALPIAVLGRLAKGTIIGVDAILECFGQRPRDWAAAAVARMAHTGNEFG